MAGQAVAARVERVVDGDTVRLTIEDRSVALRVQCLDTEESQAFGGKPVTPWGKAATDYAATLMRPGDQVTVLLESDAPLLNAEGRVAVQHLDNFNRMLGLLRLHAPLEDGGPPTYDFQELMIRQGYSPYFVKYGRVFSPELDRRYAAAERAAQAGGLGLWDQIAVNGSVARDYPTLGIWWELRAQLIDGFRARRTTAPEGTLLNSRLDYTELVERAARGETATVFLELRAMRPAGRHALIETGSLAQPFTIFLPEADDPARGSIRRLLAARYLGTDEIRPGRNYAYVTGPLQLWRGRPELLLTEIDQIADHPA